MKSHLNLKSAYFVIFYISHLHSLKMQQTLVSVHCQMASSRQFHLDLFGLTHINNKCKYFHIYQILNEVTSILV